MELAPRYWGANSALVQAEYCGRRTLHRRDSHANISPTAHHDKGPALALTHIRPTTLRTNRSGNGELTRSLLRVFSLQASTLRWAE